MYTKYINLWYFYLIVNYLLKIFRIWDISLNKGIYLMKKILKIIKVIIFLIFFYIIVSLIIYYFGNMWFLEHTNDILDGIDIPSFDKEKTESLSFFNQLTEDWLKKNKYFPSYFQDNNIIKINTNFNVINSKSNTLDLEKDYIIYKYTCLKYDVILRDLKSILY